jgi:hypothetical protein
MAKTTRTARTKKKNEEPLKLSDALRQIGARIGLLGALLTLLTSFTLPGAITTAVSGDFTLNEQGTSNIIQNIKVTAPLTIGLTIIFFVFIRDWIQNVVFLYLFTALVLAGTSFLFSASGRSVLEKAWHEADGNIIFSFPARLIAEYARLYFWAPFAGSLITSLFLAWALNKLWKVRRLE